MSRQKQFAILIVFSGFLLAATAVVVYALGINKNPQTQIEIESPFVADQLAPTSTPSTSSGQAPSTGSGQAPSTGSGQAPTPTPTSTDNSSQIDKLLEKIANLEQDIIKLKKANIDSDSTPLEQVSQAEDNRVKEYYIYLGTGQTSNRDWTEMTSATASFDTSNYNHIKAVYFEAGLSIIGGEAHARLKNSTTGNVFYETEVWHNTVNSSWKTSSPFSLPAGFNKYMVELKSSSGELAKLDGARLKIVVD